MTGALLALAIAVAAAGGPTATSRPAQVASDMSRMLAERLRAVVAEGHGVFNEDVTSLVAPAFPPGLTFAAATDVARREGFGPLRPFKGHGEAGAATWVAELDLSDERDMSVFAVVYLAFAEGTDGPILRHTMAFLRASDM